MPTIRHAAFLPAISPPTAAAVRRAVGRRGCQAALISHVSRRFPPLPVAAVVECGDRGPLFGGQVRWCGECHGSGCLSNGKAFDDIGELELRVVLFLMGIDVMILGSLLWGCFLRCFIDLGL